MAPRAGDSHGISGRARCSVGSHQGEPIRATQPRGTGVPGPGSQARCSSLPAPALWVEVPSPQGGSVCPPVKTGSEPCGAVQQLDRSVGCRQGEASPTGLHVRGGEHAEMPMSEVWTLQTRGPSHWELVDGNTGQPDSVAGPQDTDEDADLPLRKPPVARRLSGFPAG